MLAEQEECLQSYLDLPEKKSLQRVNFLKGSYGVETLEPLLYFSIGYNKFSILCDSTQRMEIKSREDICFLTLLFGEGHREVRRGLGKDISIWIRWSAISPER